MRVALTGANGFVGRHLVARLRLARHEVRALISERPGAEKELPGSGTDVDVRRVDVRKPETLQGAFDGCDAVVHTVAIPTERKQAFDADPVDRKGSGVRRYQILRSRDDPNYVMIDLEFDSIAEAESFRSKLQRLWSGPAKAVMQNPRARIVDSVEIKEL